MQDYRAPIGESQLRVCLDDEDDAWFKTFDLLFRNNPVIAGSFNCYSPHGFAKLNFVQRQFVGFDIWYARFLNGGFEAAFGDPTSSVVAANVAIPVLGWPEFEVRLKVAIEAALGTSEEQLVNAIGAAEDVWSTARRLVDASGWQADRLAREQIAAGEEFEARFLMLDRQRDLDRRVLASIWKHRHDLIRTLH